MLTSVRSIMSADIGAFRSVRSQYALGFPLI